MMNEDKNYDELLYPILHYQGGVVEFLDTIFEFLNRRSDFFRIKKDPQSQLGLFLGEAEKLIRTIFYKYYNKAVEQHHAELQQSAPSDTTDIGCVLPVREEVIISSGDGTSSNETSEDHNIKEKTSKSEKVGERVYVSDPDCYNGARFDNYSWAQSYKDLDIHVKLPQHVTKSGQVKVDIKQQYIKVETREELEWKTLIEGDLTWKINVEESAWTLMPGEHIHINLEKIEERWWESFLTSEPKIDIHKIDASKNYEDLDEESRAKIQELMYNEHQKRLGKPTIQQSKMTEVLREAWDLENSPFKGMPFDPTMLDMSGSDITRLK